MYLKSLNYQYFTPLLIIFRFPGDRQPFTTTWSFDKYLGDKYLRVEVKSLSVEFDIGKRHKHQIVLPQNNKSNK